MTPLDHVIVLAFAIVYPAYAFISYPRVKRDLVANKPGVRVREYRETIVWLWLLGIVATGGWALQDRTLTALGFGLTPNWPVWVGFGVALLLAVMSVRQFRQAARDEQQRQSLRTAFARVDASEWLPRTTREAGWFLAVSFSAGVWEEVLFRGFLLWYFDSFGTAVAVLLSSVLFGAAHLYQGWRGALKVSGVGVFLAVAFVLTDTLWVPILLHVVIDVQASMLGWVAFRDVRQVARAG